MLQENLPRQLQSGQPIELLLAPANLGYAGGINFAIDRTRPASAYWILNPDTQPDPEALETMLARLDRGDCSAVGHDLVGSDGRLGSRGGRWLKWSARAISLDKGKPRRPVDDIRRLEDRLDYISGASLLVTRGFCQRVGKMREDYFLYCEEVEWCLRAIARGEKLGYAADAVVRHAQGTATGAGGKLRAQSKLSVYLMERNRVLLTRDLYPGLMPVAVPLSLLHIAIKYIKAGAWRQGSYALSGWLAGLGDKRNKPGWLERGAAPGATGKPAESPRSADELVAAPMSWRDAWPQKACARHVMLTPASLCPGWLIASQTAIRQTRY